MRSATGREVDSSSAPHSKCASTAWKYSKSAPLSTTAGARFFVKTVKSKTMRKLTWCHGSAKSSTERVVLSNVRTHDKHRQPNDETLCTRTLTNHRPTEDVTPKPVTTDQGLHSHEQRRPATDETNLLDTAHHTFTQILTLLVGRETSPGLRAEEPQFQRTAQADKPTPNDDSCMASKRLRQAAGSMQACIKLFPQHSCRSALLHCGFAYDVQRHSAPLACAHAPVGHCAGCAGPSLTSHSTLLRRLWLLSGGVTGPPSQMLRGSWVRLRAGAYSS